MSERVCRRGHAVGGANAKVRPSSGKTTCLACSRAVDYVRLHPGADAQKVADWQYGRIMRPELPERTPEAYRWDWVAAAEPEDAEFVAYVRDRLKDWAPEASR